MSATKPMRVTWTQDDELRCAILAGMGFSTKFIMEETGLTACQISYRLRKAAIKRADYRNGQSAVAERVLGYAPASKQAIRGILKLEVIK
jgi:hypothetical protein